MLILHVGAHKTGTTSMQTFFARHHGWLLHEYNVHVHPGKWPETCIDENCSHVGHVKGLCSEKKTVVLSSESFPLDAAYVSGGLKPSTYLQLIFQLFAPMCGDVLAVVSHRKTMDWAVSMWSQSQGSAYRFHSSGSPEPLGGFLARQQIEGHGHPTYLLGLPRSAYYAYERAIEVLGTSRVVVVSADRLWETNRTVGAYLVCELALRLAGSGLEHCDREVWSRESVIREGISPSAIIRDTVRIVRLICMGACGSPTASGMTARAHARDSSPFDDFYKPSSPIAWAALAAALPQTCVQPDANVSTATAAVEPTAASLSMLEVLSSNFDASFLQRTNATPPTRLTSKPICLIDESQLNSVHLQLIRKYMPPCKH